MTSSLKQEPFAGQGKHLILYDGVCGLCNRLNQFVLAHDGREVFDFAPLQSAIGQSIVRYFGRNPEDLNTFYLVTNYRSESPGLLSKSRGAIAVLEKLDAPWRWLTVSDLLPQALLDWGYDLVVRHRYRILGRSESCMLPPPRYLQRFIDRGPKEFLSPISAGRIVAHNWGLLGHSMEGE